MATIDYNSNTALADVRIDSWRTEKVTPDDDVSQESTRHIITGQGFLHGDTASEFNAILATFRRQFAKPGAPLIIRLGGANPQDIVVNMTEGDDFDGPHTSHDVIQLTHVSAVVPFEITYDLYESALGIHDVMSHTWTQRFVVAESGLSTYFVTGTLRIAKTAVGDDADPGGGWDGSTTGVEGAGDPTRFDIGSNPDRYRDVVLPELPKGFRTVRMEFAVDESQTRLAYSIEMQEMARSLPAPARSGTGSFRWRKSFSGSAGMMGLKIVDIELEADKHTPPARLLEAAHNIASFMVNFSGAGADMILEVEVEQPEIFNANKVVLRIVAQGNALPTSNVEGPLQPLNVNLVNLGQFLEGLDPSQPPGPYATKSSGDPKSPSNPDVAQTIYRIKQQVRYVPDDSQSSLPRAQVEEPTRNVIEQVYSIPDAQYDDLEIDIPPASTSDPTTQQLAFQYINVDVNEWVDVEDSGMRVLHPRSLNAPGIPFQIAKPRVLLYSEATLIRRGAPPERTFLKVPQGGTLISERFRVRPGNFDAHNHRLYVALHQRVIQLADHGESPEGVAVGGFGTQNGFRTFWPPNSLIAFPHDPRIEVPATARGRTIFQPIGGKGNTEQNLPVGPQPPNHYFQPQPE